MKRQFKCNSDLTYSTMNENCWICHKPMDEYVLLSDVKALIQKRIEGATKHTSLFTLNRQQVITVDVLINELECLLKKIGE